MEVETERERERQRERERERDEERAGEPATEQSGDGGRVREIEATDMESAFELLEQGSKASGSWKNSTQAAR